MQVHALIPAAGRGARYGTAENKIFASLNGRAVIVHTAEAFLRCASVDTVTIVGQADELGRIRELVGDIIRATAQVLPRGRVPAGIGISWSRVRIALAARQPDDLVLVHDAARPLVSADLIERCIRKPPSAGTAIAAYPWSDTIKRVAAETARGADDSSRQSLGGANPSGGFLGGLPPRSTKLSPQFAAPMKPPSWSMPALRRHRDGRARQHQDYNSG